MLLNIKRYLVQHQRTSIRDLALHFDTEQDAMRGMLEPWIKKGKVRKCETATTCGGCSDGCPSTSDGEMEVYEWVEEKLQFSALNRTATP